MNISLTPEMGKWVAGQVESGLYKSTNEAIRDGLRTLQRLEAQRRAMVDDLRTELLIGIKQLDADKAKTFDASLVADLKKQGRSKTSF